MRGLQVSVGLVLGVPVAVVVQRGQFATHVLAGFAVAGRSFVNVIAQVNDQVQVLAGQVLQRREQACLVVLATGKGKPQPIRRAFGRRSRSRAADRAGFAGGLEPVPVSASRLESLDLHVDAVSQPRRSRGGPGLDDLGHCLVGSDLPGDRHILRRHASTFKRLGRQSRPEHHALRLRISGSHAQRERVIRKPHAAVGGYAAR